MMTDSLAGLVQARTRSSYFASLQLPPFFLTRAFIHIYFNFGLMHQIQLCMVIKEHNSILKIQIFCEF